MRKSPLIAFVVIAVGVIALAYAEQKGTMSLKVGDEVYACNCGVACSCNTMSNSPGNCTCGTPMVKARVVRVEGDIAYLKAAAWKVERPFKTTGKYVCACDPTCKCNTVSQNPGKCPCGVEMKKAD